LVYLEISPSFLQTVRNNKRAAQEIVPLLGETKQECLDRHLKRCLFKEGDFARFKRPKRNPIYGKITHIEKDPDKVTWSQKGMVPNYITVEVYHTDKRTKETKTTVVKTLESKLLYTGKQ
jgi:hypothetical protein